MEIKLIATNRQAKRDYEILETYEAGMELRGAEIKSLREGRANLKDSFARIEEGEVYLYNTHISPYEKGCSLSQEPKRVRKLLLHKSQIRKLLGLTSQKGFTLIPLQLYFKGSFAKVKLALAKGRRLYDKREVLKKKQVQREIARAMRRKSRKRRG